MTRIADTFARLRAERRPGLVTFTTAGDPDLDRSADILRALDRAGADVLEVGVPFSDPLADGPVIQRATERALAAGTTLRNVLSMIERVRPSISSAIVIVRTPRPSLLVVSFETVPFQSRAMVPRRLLHNSLALFGRAAPACSWFEAAL